MTFLQFSTIKIEFAVHIEDEIMSRKLFFIRNLVKHKIICLYIALIYILFSFLDGSLNN